MDDFFMKMLSDLMIRDIVIFKMTKLFLNNCQKELVGDSDNFTIEDVEFDAKELLFRLNNSKNCLLNLNDGILLVRGKEND